MTVRRKPTAVTWRRLADAARASREEQHWTRPELARRANVSEGSVERLETARRPQTDKFPRAYAWVLSALGWPDGWAESILNGTETLPPVDLNRPNGPYQTASSSPKVEKLLAHLVRGDAQRVIAAEVPTAQIVELMSFLADALLEREAMDAEWVPSQATPDRRRSRSEPQSR